MAITVLSVSSIPAVAETHPLMLEQSGYKVLSATTLRDFEEMCSRERFQCVMIAQDITAKVKASFGQLIENES